MQRTLIVVGLVILLAGVGWPWLARLPLGRLPGDVLIDRPGFKLYFPFTTMLLFSIIISLLLWFFRK